MQILRTLTIAVFGLALATGTIGCKKKEAGPAEKLGQKMDAAAEGAVKATTDAAEKVEDAAEKATK